MEEQTKYLIGIFKLLKEAVEGNNEKKDLDIGVVRYRLSTDQKVTISSQYYPIIFKTQFTDITRKTVDFKKCIAFNIATRKFEESSMFTADNKDISVVEKGIQIMMQNKR